MLQQGEPKYTNAAIASVSLIFCLSGSALTIINKMLMTFLPAPNFVLFLQNCGTLGLLLAGRHAVPFSIDNMTREKVVKWMPLVLLFYGMLVSSMFALKSVTATTLIVQRNLATVTIAIAEYFFLGTKQNLRRVFAILAMCVGSVLYAHDDLLDATFDIVGYTWLAVNIVTTTSYQIKVKSLVNELGLNSWTMSYYNNSLSLPFCLIFLALFNEVKPLTIWLESFSSPQVCLAAISCTLGFLLSVSAFQLNRMISPTSITVLNNTNKFVLIFFTAFTIDSATLSTKSVLGMIVVMAAAASYSLSANKKT
jgi:hypothetical protein